MSTLNDTQRWHAVERRDRGFDGTFYVAVKTTGVYCRPSCSARTPKRVNVTFFATPTECEQAGYRACKRCKPDLAEDPQLALARAVAGALEQAAESEPESMPSLAALAERFNFSPFHLQRVFKRHLGVSPKQYALGLRQKQLKRTLRRAARVTEAVYAAGYNSQSQAGVAQELGMTPTQYRNGGAPEVAYAIVDCPLGLLLVAATVRGICKVALGESRRELAQAVREEFPAAHVNPEHPHLSAWVAAVLDYLRGAGPHPNLPTDVRATAFQRKVWTALRRIPAGQTRSYAQLARTIGQPTAARAVANACGANPTAIVVPCHRVIHGDGTLSGYRWGIERKRQLLDIEGASAR